MKRILIGFFALYAAGASAQMELSSFTTTGRGGATSFVTDYQAVGINPANLGWTWDFEEKRVAFGMMENTFSLHSTALQKEELRTDLWDVMLGREGAEFTYDEKVLAAKDFSDAGFSIDMDFGVIGVAVTLDKVGGFGFRINSHTRFYSQLGPTASEILFLGRTAPYFDSLTAVDGTDTTVIANDPNTYNIDSLNSADAILFGFSNAPQLFSDLLDGTRITMNSYVDYNLSYGRKLFEIDSTFALFAGVGIKYIQGLAYMELYSENGDLTAFSSISPAFPIDYGDAAASNPSNIAQDGSFPPKAVGDGFGFDFGVNALLFNKLRVSAAFTNAGRITWDGNVYSVKDTLLYDLENPGANSYNFIDQLDGFTGEDGLLEWKGEESRTVALPSLFRFGASIELGKIAHIGFDALFPVNETAGSLESPLFGFGGDVSPIKWLRLSAGFMTGGNYDFQVPLGLTFVAPGGTYEFGIASRDAVTFFAQNGPTLSWSMGFLRFRV